MKIEPEEKTKTRAKRTVTLPNRKFRMPLRANISMENLLEILENV